MQIIKHPGDLSKASDAKHDLLRVLHNWLVGSPGKAARYEPGGEEEQILAKPTPEESFYVNPPSDLTAEGIRRRAKVVAASDAKICIQYAETINRNNKGTPIRFETGEPTIAMDGGASLLYAMKFIKGRFVLGEPVISKDPEFSYNYALYVMKKLEEIPRFELGEPAIATNAFYSYYYAYHVIGKRFMLGEPIIAKSRDMSLQYARFVIKGRFPAGEKAIMESERFLNLYIEALRSLGHHNVSRLVRVKEAYTTVRQLKINFPELMEYLRYCKMDGMPAEGDEEENDEN